MLVQRFAALPGTKSYLLHVGPGGSAGQVAEQSAGLGSQKPRRTRPAPSGRRSTT